MAAYQRYTSTVTDERLNIHDVVMMEGLSVIQMRSRTLISLFDYDEQGEQQRFKHILISDPGTMTDLARFLMDEAERLRAVRG